MGIESDLRTLLTQNTVLSGLIGTRIYPDKIPPHDSPSPWISFSLSDELPDQRLASNKSTKFDYDFEIYAETSGLAKLVKSALRTALDGKRFGYVGLALFRSSSGTEVEGGHLYTDTYQISLGYAPAAAQIWRFNGSSNAYQITRPPAPYPSASFENLTVSDPLTLTPQLFGQAARPTVVDTDWDIAGLQPMAKWVSFWALVRPSALGSIVQVVFGSEGGQFPLSLQIVGVPPGSMVVLASTLLGEQSQDVGLTLPQLNANQWVHFLVYFVTDQAQAWMRIVVNGASGGQYEFGDSIGDAGALIQDFNVRGFIFLCLPIQQPYSVIADVAVGTSSLTPSEALDLSNWIWNGGTGREFPTP